MEDAEIVDLYLARDERALTETAARYGPRLRGLAGRILEDGAAAEECENDTYLEAWNSIPPHEPRGYLCAYLMRITRHLAIDRCRAQSRQKRACRLEALTEELADCLPSSEDVEGHLDAKQLGEAINAFLRALPEEKRNVFLRRYWYCDPVSEIARRFGYGESKVKTMLHRTRNELREHLEKEGFSL